MRYMLFVRVLVGLLVSPPVSKNHTHIQRKKKPGIVPAPCPLQSGERAE